MSIRSYQGRGGRGGYGVTARKIGTFLLYICIVLIIPAIAAAEKRLDPCSSIAPQRIWIRPATAPSGSDFARRTTAMSEDDREQAIEAELMAGNMPSFLKRLVPVTLS